MPIPGTKKANRLEENLGAADLKLTAAEIEQLDGAMAKIAVQGGRYPDHMERTTGL